MTDASRSNSVRLDQVEVGDALPELAVELRLDRLVFAAVFHRRRWLRIKRIDVTAATGQKDLDRRLCRGFAGWQGRTWTPCGESTQAEAAEHAPLQEDPTAEP